jgi:ubiquinone/menaquinone biosynthesis C-methylase UbiE
MPEATKPTGGAMNPADLMQMGMSFMTGRVLSAAVQLNMFSHIASGHQTAKAVAAAAGTSERGTRMLLDALTGLELLTKSGDHYRLTPASEKYLVRQSPDYVGAILENDSLWDAWNKLVEVVRTGKPVRRVEKKSNAEEFFPILIRSLHVLNREPARLAAQALGAGVTRKSLQVLDIACGSGVWGIGVAEADAAATVTFQDFPGVLEHTRGYAQRHGLESRSAYLAGDLKQVDLGSERFDVAMLGNIAHSEGERSTRDLFRRLHRALRPSGQVAIIDMVPNDQRTGPPYPLIFAVNMLVNTEFGDTYTLAEYRTWLTEAGFTRVETADIQLHSPLIIGTKDR